MLNRFTFTSQKDTSVTMDMYNIQVFFNPVFLNTSNRRLHYVVLCSLFQRAYNDIYEVIHHVIYMYWYFWYPLAGPTQIRRCRK
jgi:hypothetical protein